MCKAAPQDKSSRMKGVSSATVPSLAGLRALLGHAILLGSWILGTSVVSTSIIVAWLRGAYVTTSLLVLAATHHLVVSTRPWPAFVRAIQSLNLRAYYRRAALYLPKSLPREKTMFCYAPHGVVSCGFNVNGVWAREFEQVDIMWYVSTAFFVLPVISQVVGWKGNLNSASAKSLEKRMRTGGNVGIIPGGFEEATICARGEDRVYLRGRKGFVKFALRYGYSLCPVFTFGESECYWTFPYGVNWRLWLNRFKIPGCAFFGNPVAPLLPRRGTDLLTFVGEPVALPTIAKPSTADVDRWHAVYVDALRHLFDANKVKAGCDDRDLVVL